MTNITVSPETQSAPDIVKSNDLVARLLNAAANLDFVAEDLGWALDDVIEDDEIAKGIRDVANDMRNTFELLSDNVADLVIQAGEIEMLATNNKDSD
jgi:hypothetical protein